MNINIIVFIAMITVVSAEQNAAFKNADIVDIPEEYTGWLHKIGNVRVIYNDGRNEMCTKEGNCLIPHVSQRGTAVGWMHFSKLGGKFNLDPLDETLKVLLLDGSEKVFRPNEEYPFIESWGFDEDGESIVIKSRGHHGPQFLVKINMRTGKIMEEIAYRPIEEIPTWAKPYADY